MQSEIKLAVISTIKQKSVNRIKIQFDFTKSPNHVDGSIPF